ncbi:MAG: DUF2860 domain-containing protein [Desulfobulbaceae bacterium]|nr:DUF2860 domain-containing protein [Desulfobulbaceae bacterium]
MLLKLAAKKKLKVLALTLSLSSCFALPSFSAFAEEAPPPLTDEQLRQETEKLFRQAMEKRDSGDIYSSIEDFQTILSNQPKLHRARLEMAVAFYQTYRFEQAVKEAQYVLDDPETPPNVRVAILAFMAQVKQDSERLGGSQHTWKFPFEAGYIYDTNVNVGPDSIADIGLQPGAEKQSDSGYIASVGAEHTYLTRKRYNWGSKPTSLLWQSGTNLYTRQYNDEDQYDLTVLSVRTGPTFVTTGSWRANLSFQEDIIAWGGSKYALFSHAMAAYTWHWGESGLETTIDGLLSRRDYSKEGYQGRDSVYLAPRLSAGYTFYDGKIALQSGIQYINENATDDFYSNDGFNVYVNGSWKMREHTSIYTGYSHTESRYDTPYDRSLPGWDEARDEIERRYKIGLVHTFKNFGMLSDWSLNIETTHTTTDSNLSAYDYSRSVTTVSLTRRF